MTKEEAIEILKNYFKDVQTRYNAKLEVLDIEAGSGYNSKTLKDSTLKLF